MWRSLNYFEHLLHFISAVRGRVSILRFASLIGVLAGVASSAIIAGSKKYESIIKNKN